MNTQNMKKTSIIATLAVVSIALVLGLSQTENIKAADAPKGNGVYLFAEGVNPHVTFTFGDKTEEVDFQLFTQTQGFENNGRGTSPQFTLTKIAGGTPYLYDAVDTVHANGLDSRQSGSYFDFSAKVDLMQAGEPVRTLKYDRCNITNYKIDTRTDNEEGYTTGGKTGFAVTETFTFDCGGYVGENPALVALMKEQNKKPYE
jgi:hypothetical protein